MAKDPKSKVDQLLNDLLERRNLEEILEARDLRRIYTAPRACAIFCVNGRVHHAGTRSGNTSAKWFSAAAQSCTGRVQRSLAFMIAR